MFKSKEVTAYISKFEKDKQERLETLRTHIHDVIPEVSEKLWTNVPFFHTKEKSIMIRVFSTHIHLVADNVMDYRDELSEYSVTPKGMLKIYDHQNLPLETIDKIFENCGRPTHNS